MKCLHQVNKLMAAAALLVVTGATQAGVITVPNYDFSVGTYNTSTLTSTIPSGTPVAQTASLAGWQVSVTPMTFNGGTYYNYTPYATVWNNGWYGSGAAGQPAFLAVFGGEPNAGYYWTGGPTNPANHEETLMTGTSAVLTSTGITDLTVAGATYAATIAVGGSSWMDMSYVNAIQPTYTINILDNGNVVSSNVINSPTFNTWTDISTNYLAPASGDSIQIQVVATNFYADCWAPFSDSFATFSNARLTESAPAPEPGTLLLLATGTLSLLAARRRRA